MYGIQRIRKNLKKKNNVPYWSFDGQTWREQVAVIAEIAKEELIAHKTYKTSNKT